MLPVNDCRYKEQTETLASAHCRRYIPAHETTRNTPEQDLDRSLDLVGGNGRSGAVCGGLHRTSAGFVDSGSHIPSVGANRHECAADVPAGDGNRRARDGHR